MKMFFSVLAAAALLSLTTLAATVTNLEVNARTEPMGIDDSAPEFRWQMQSDERGKTQSAYRIEVRDDENTVVWDSGEVASSESHAVKYDGQPLTSATRYTWNVTVWDEDNNELATAGSWFETGLFEVSDWSGASFIAPGAESPVNYSIDFDFKINSTALGFVFGAKDASHFLMWQIATYDYNNGCPGTKVMLRPHVWDTWASCITEVDVSSIIPLSKAYDLHHMKLEIRGNTVYTYLDGVKTDYVYTSDFAAYGKIGFRETGDGRYSECSSFDNVTVTNDDTGNVMYSNDFEKDSAPFTIGIRENGMYKQEWNNAADLQSVGTKGPSEPMFRKTFTVKPGLVSARLYSSALGLYEAFLNGSKVGTDKMAPGWTDYNIRVQYQTHDVTNMLSEGDNAIGAAVGKGWYAGHVSTAGLVSRYGVDTAFIAKLVLTYDDGTSETVVTDATRKASTNGPYLQTDNQNGETYDATREMAGWNTAGFQDSGWSSAIIATKTSINTLVDPQNIALVGEIQDPVTVIEEKPVRFLAKTGTDTYVYDVGQNISGIIRINVSGSKGTTLKLRHGEMVYKDTNKLYTENLREAQATDTYVLKGDAGGETYEPAFTFHGFRYVEVSGLGYKPDEADITALVVHSKLKRTGWIETNNAKVNQLFSNIIWSQRDNYLSVPTDCPQRDERLGWTGDAQIFSRTATLNFDIDAFYTKFLVDVDDARDKSTGAICDIAPKQGHSSIGFGNSGWADFAVVAPWTLYTAYGDKTILSDNWDMMKEWVAYYANKAGNSYILPADAYGDWLSVELTPGNITATSFFAHSTELMAKISAVLGKTEDEAYYLDLFDKIRTAYVNAFIDSETGMIPTGNTQTAYALAIRFNLLPTEELRSKAGENLVKRIDGNLSTGTMGCAHLLPALSDTGYSELAYKLLLSETYPSWLYSVVNGSTTIWERWNSYIAETGTFGNVNMNSFNHYAYGAVAEWMYEYAAGIRYDENMPGYQHIIIAPIPSTQLNHIKGTFDSPYGRIVSDWTLDGSDFTLTVTVPANTSAAVTVPSDGTAVNVDGNADFASVNGVLSAVPSASGTTFEVGSGTYVFTSTLDLSIGVTVSADETVAGKTFTQMTINGETLNYASFNKGDAVTLSASALNSEEYAFDHWYGDIESTENPLVFTAEESVSIKAAFRYVGRTNLAYGKTATASSTYEEGTHWSTRNLTDGLLISTSDTYGYASDGSTTPESTVWATVDLGDNTLFDFVRLYPRTEAFDANGKVASFPVDFTVQVSTDGTNFTTVATVTSLEAPGLVPHTVTFDRQNARYVRINATHLGNFSINDYYYRLQFAEIGVYNSSDVFCIRYKGSSEIIELTGAYTLGSTYNGENVREWRINNSIYAPGTTLAVSELEGRTITPVTDSSFAAKPESYDETLGELVYFSNFSDTPYALADLDVIDVGKETLLIQDKFAVRAENLNTIGILNGQNVHGIELVSSDGLEYALTYNDGTPVEGKFTIVYEAITTDDSAINMFNVANNTSFGADEWIGYRLNWSGMTLQPSVWIKWQSSTVTADQTLRRIGTRAGALGRTIYFHSVAAYVKEPENALWLSGVDGENKTFTTISGENYTFPYEFGAEPCGAWTDGTTLYAAGSTITKAEAAGKTFRVSNTAPTTLDLASIRTTGTQGIRFAAFVDEERRLAADEYGFIIARKTSVGSDYSKLVFDETGSKSAVNEYGVNYTSGVSYNPDAAIDLIYDTAGDAFGSSSLGAGYYFTAVLHNIAPAFYKEVLVVKPYVRIDGQYFYGESAERSIYDVAVSIRDGGYTGLDETGKAVIDGIISNAK